MAAELPSTTELSRLPDNHRRVVAALLATLSRHVRDLASAGAIAASPEKAMQLAHLSGALAGGPPAGHLDALREALLVQLDEIEPARLAGYGSLSPEQERTLIRLASALRALLEPPHGGPKSC
jgi:hypothetical protein